MVKKSLIATTLVAAAASITSQTTAAAALESHEEEQPQHRQLSGWYSGDDDDWWSSSSGKSGKSGSSSSAWGGNSSWSSSSGKSGKSGSSSWNSSWSSSNSSWSSSGKSGKSGSSEVWHGGWGKPGWWGPASSSGKSGKSGSSEVWHGGWGKPGWWGPASSSGKSGKSGGSNSGWSSSSSSGWSSSGKSGKSKGSKSKGSKSKGSKAKSAKGGRWGWSDSSSDGWKPSNSWSSSGKSGKSGSSSSGGGWYGKNDDDWSGGHSSNNKPPSKPDFDDWFSGYEGGHTSSSKPKPVSAPTHPTGWKDDGWDADEYYKADIEGIRQECNAMIEASERELLPKFLRMVFHDCVGSACDGCINLDNIDNNGLREPMEGIYPLVKKYSNKLSRPDVWAICAIEAASMAVPGDHYFPLHFIGRKACADADDMGIGGEDHAMCSNDMSNREVVEFFATNFGMDARETVCIMGVHSASTANRQNSGFGNPDREDGWVVNAEEYILSNKYFTTMKSNVWELQKTMNVYPIPNRYQWYFGTIDEGPIMTNSDISIFWDMEGYIKTDPEGDEGLVMCALHPDAEFEIEMEGVDGEDIPLCPFAESTKEFVEMYAEDNDLFIKDFGPAMNKILNWGYHTYDY